MIKPNIDCPGCNNTRRLFLRGLCNGCYRSPVIRDKHATRDKRFAVLYNAPRVVALRNKAVEDIRPGVVWKVAIRVAEKFGGRIDPEDLVQEAYLYALRAANNLPKKFDPVAAPLWPAVKKYVILKMYRAARRMAGNTSHFQDSDPDLCPVVVFEGVMRRAVSVSPTTR